MTLRIRPVVVAFAIFLPGVIFSSPTVRLFHPAPGMYGLERLWRVEVRNPDAQSYKVRLRGEITEEEKGVVFTGETKEFEIQAHQTKVLRYGSPELQMAPGYPTYAKGYEHFAARTGGLPPGDYTFRVWLLPDFGEGMVRFRSMPAGPPRLVSPKNGAELQQEPLFTWMPPRPKPSGPVSYRLKLVEVLPGQSVEEALKANPEWFQKKGIRGTSFRYPVSGRRIEKGRKYAWQVTAEASGIQPLVSEKWGFSRFGLRPGLVLLNPLKVTRTVVRFTNWFLVALHVENISSSEVENIRLSTTNVGFQCVDGGDHQSVYTKSDGKKCQWKYIRDKLGGGKSFNVTYMAVPALVGPPVPPRVLCESVAVSCKVGASTSQRTLLLPWSDAGQIHAAMREADYVLLTCPRRMFNQFGTTPVNALLSSMANLAARKRGVVAYAPYDWYRSDIKFALLKTSMWGQLLADDWAAGGGYLLIVGRTGIIPAWEPPTTCYPDDTGGKVRTSDHGWANLSGDMRPELRVGRLPGNIIREMVVPMETALDNAPAGQQRALLVGGPEATWEPNVRDIETAAGILVGKGIPVTKVHTEYKDSKKTQLHHSILVWLHAHGADPDSVLKALLKDPARTEWQLAVGLLWLTGTKYQGLFTTLNAAIAWAILLEGASTTKAQDIAQAIPIAEGIQHARPERGGYVYPYSYYAAGMPTYQQRCAPVKAGCTNKQLICWEGHGNVGSWSAVMVTSANPYGVPIEPIDLSGKPVVVSFSCLTGVYEGYDGYPQAFLRNGAAAFLGSTEDMSYARMTECMEGLLWKHWKKFSRIGDVMFDLKTEVLNSGISDEGNKYFVNQFNLYGDPKYTVWR
jgi:hypothetical protein